MLIIGLTGPSGAGKGTFAQHLPFPCLDTDKIAREVVKKGMPCLDELCAAFGSEILLTEKRSARLRFRIKSALRP